jgi:integrase
MSKPYLRKRGRGWEITFYHPKDGDRKYISLPPGTPKQIAEARRDDIAIAIRKHKLGIQEFTLGEQRIDTITLGEFADKVLNDPRRRRKVSRSHLKRNALAMRIFTDAMGKDFVVAKLRPQHIEQFRLIRHTDLIAKYERKGWSADEERIKRGINTELRNVRMLFNYAIEIGSLAEHSIPKIKLEKTEPPDTPILDDTEIFKLSEYHKKRDNYTWLAFCIIRYTGARLGAIVRDSKNSKKGLKWNQIDWMRNVIHLHDKRKRKSPPMHEELRKILLEARNCHDPFDPTRHVIPYRKDTISHRFRDAMVAVGIDKPGAVHILRHTAATKLLEAGLTESDLMEWFGWSSRKMLDRYVHITNRRLQKLIRQVNL